MESVLQPRGLHATVVAVYERVLAFAIPWNTSVVLVLSKAYSCSDARTAYMSAFDGLSVQSA